MSNYIRPRIPGATIFFTVAAANRGTTLLIDEIDRLRAAVGLTRRERPFDVDAWVVLPDQMHCMWTLPRGDRDYATRWRLIKSRFSRGLRKGRLSTSQEQRQERGIWQRRFWEHHIRSRTDYDDHLRFCMASPVELGLVARPDEWPYSSFYRSRKSA